MEESSYQNSVEGGADAIVAGNNNEVADHNEKGNSFPWGKICVAAVLVGIVAYVVVDSLTTKNVQTGLRVFLEWIQSNPVAGAFAFVGVYVAATVAFLPGSILTLGGGFVFGGAFGLGPGIVLATSAVFVGAGLGAIARYLLRDWVCHGLVEKYPMVKALDGAFKRRGFFIFLLLRLSPIVPFNAINYIGGVTSVRLRHYALALVGILPGTVLYCSIGATAGSLTAGSMSGPAAIASITVGIVLGLLAVFVASYYARMEFDAIVAHRCSSSANDGEPADSSAERPTEEQA